MSLTVFKKIKKIDGFDVVQMDQLRDKHPHLFHESGQMKWKEFEEQIRDHKFVYYRGDKQSLSFTFQNGPIKEVGVNGCQVDTLIAGAVAILRSFNDSLPCRENDIALARLEEAYMWLKARKADRENRDVEGESKL